MVSTFSGSEWRIADDPQPGTHDHSMRGSFWPSFGDAMNKNIKFLSVLPLLDVVAHQ